MKKICFIISFLLLILLVYKVAGTYALLESKTNRVVETGLGHWTILVNNVDITRTYDFTIDSMNWDGNENVKEKKIAPGVGGYFDLTVDPTGTDVSVRCDISFDFSVFENSSIDVTSIAVVDGPALIKTAADTYTGVIKLSDIKAGLKSTIRVYIVWENTDETSDYDTSLGMVHGNVLEIPISVSASQYTGEEIVEYVESEEPSEGGNG